MQILLDMLLAAAALAVLAFIFSWYTRERPAVRRAQAKVLNLAVERRKREALKATRYDRLWKR